MDFRLQWKREPGYKEVFAWKTELELAGLSS